MSTPAPDFYLASASPRRRELLAQLRYRFAALQVDIDETPRPGETAAGLVLRLAGQKAAAGTRLVELSGPRPVLGADTAVSVDGRILGKPATCDEAVAMLSLLSGREHEVLTGVALLTAGRLATVLSATTVVFRTVTVAEMRRYWDTGEPRDKAGGYAIQGLAAAFVARIEGSYSGVVGLPLFETVRLLQDSGVSGWLQDGTYHE
jgi:septum formation protein